MNKFISLLVFVLVTVNILANNNKAEEPKNWAERLGFGKNKKVIILHADDAGMCKEANIATQKLLTNNFIQSAAIMVPSPAAEEMLQWVKENPTEDVGVHLTLTSEWLTYRWGTISDVELVPGLLDIESKMWHSVQEVVMNATPDEVEREIRAQIDKFIATGIRPGHIDTHMGTLYAHPDFIKVFFNIAEKYGIPANVIDLSNPDVVEGFKKQGYPLDENVVKLAANYSLPKVDFFTNAPNGDSYENKKKVFKELIKSLRPGITEIIFHPSIETENLKTITRSWKQRVWEAKMFGDEEIIQFFKDEGIIFTNWKEMMERHKEFN